MDKNSLSPIYLKKLDPSDGRDVYDMLQRIGSCENEFKNTAYGLSFRDFQDWLKLQYHWSYGVELPNGYVPQTIFWLYVGNVPVGIGKIRHILTENSREIGGNIGYAIDPLWRGNGYATILLHELLREADVLGISEKLLSVEKYNPASKRVIEKNNGILVYENEQRWFFSFR